MSGSGTIYTEQSVLGHTLGFAPMAFPAQVFVGLCSAAMPPSETVQGIEAFGGGYTRMLAQFALIDTAANIAANVASVEWPIATAGWGTLGFFELWDAPAGGNRLYWGALIDTASQLPTTITVSAGDIVRFSAGTLAVQAATGSGGTSSIGAYLPLAGGTLLGPLLLAADPTTYLQAATKQYVDAHSGTGGGPGFLPLSGGTMLGNLSMGTAAFSGTAVTVTGQLNVGTNSTGGLTTIAANITNPQNNTGALFLNRNGPTSASDDPQIGSYLAQSHTGGGVSPHVKFETVVGSNCSTWALLNQSYFSGNDTAPGTGHVGIYSQQIRSGVNTGGTQGIGAWCGCFELRSQTGLPSSQDGILQTLELDLFANGADDHAPATGRSILSLVLGQNNTSGAPVEATYGISFFLFSGHTGHYRNMIGAAAPFSNSVLGTVGATQMAGAHAIWLNDGHHIAFNSAGTAVKYWDAAISAVHHIGNQQFDNVVTAQGGAVCDGAANWSHDNYGKQLLITGGGNPAIGITDNTGANVYAAGVNFGQMIFAKMPPLSDTTTTPTYLLGLSATLNSTAVPFKFGTVGFNGTTPIAKPTVSGAKGSNAALASLLTALAAYGLVTDSTSA